MFSKSKINLEKDYLCPRNNRMDKDILQFDVSYEESPVLYAERLGIMYAANDKNDGKKKKGQFFTPSAIAFFMAQRVVCNKKKVRILDPGCGLAILSCALIQKLCSSDVLKEIELDLYENDLNIKTALQQSLSYLASWLSHRGVQLYYTVNANDFVLENYQVLDKTPSLLDTATLTYDYIISNPPYFKLSKDDLRAKAAAAIVDGQPNIYSLFMAIASKMLIPEGRLLFIVPRSFASGRYFRLFRNYFFKAVELRFVHLFNTRKETFQKDGVLQETLILECVPRIDKTNAAEVLLSSSGGIFDLDKPFQKIYAASDLIDITSTEKILYLPVSQQEDDVIKLFNSWVGSLEKYGIKISTGPVVAFRAKEAITMEKTENAAPLYWLHNVVKMLTGHPVENKEKGQWIQIDKCAKSMLIPNKNYVFLRRFSSKDDRSRLVASPYLAGSSPSRLIGVENKLNYIYRPGGHLSRTEVIGLSAILNSKIFDTYFRTFNGNVNVSASELREMPMPPIEAINEIGEKLISGNDLTEEKASYIVSEYFKVKTI